ncbi:hypothetical protein HIM_02272 [Hirsutella minnesotensis 3608]|nr:hypothetical protein HIM_02272 [Hirsutella minnesotensis 3608]
MLSGLLPLVTLSLSHWTELLLASISLLLAGYITYQITLHPLARYPGPFFAKFTSAWSVYHAFKGDTHSTLYELHRKHGRFVRYGPNHMSVLSATALEQIYGHQANVQKSRYYTAFFGTSIFNAIDKKVHARKRRVMSQAFSEKAVREMEPHVVSAIREWCSAICERDGQTSNHDNTKTVEWSSPRNMAHWAAYMVFDVLGEICFGETFGSSTRSDNRYYLQLLTQQVRSVNVVGQMRMLQHMKLGTVLMHGSRERRQQQVAFSQKQLRKRLELGPTSNGRRDIVHFLQKACDPETGEKYSVGELIFETFLLLAAGSDTANTALASIFYFLVHNPPVLKRLTASIRSTFPDVESIVSGPRLSSLTYLRACVDESLRLCPPVPMLLPREVLPGGLTVEGHYFKAGCTIGVPTYSLHHSEEHFDRPFQFKPERWLVKGTDGVEDGEGRSADDIGKSRQAFAPFSIGPRSCIARGVAVLELYLGVARALWLYDLQIAPGYETMGVGIKGEYKIKDHFIVGKEGPVLQFRRAST